MNPDQKSLKSYTRKAAVTIALLVVGILVMLAFIKVVHWLLVIFAAVLFGVFLYSLAFAIRRILPIPHAAALTIVVAVLLGLIVSGVLLLGPEVIEQTGQLSEKIPEAISSVRDYLGQFESIDNLIGRMESDDGMNAIRDKILGGLPQLIATGTHFIVISLIVFFAGIFFAVQPELYRRNLLLLFPEKHRKIAFDTSCHLGEALRWWLVGRFASMIVVGILTGIGVWLVGIPLALTLGIIAAILSFVPVLGPALTSIPLALVALSERPILVIWALVVYMIVQVLESYLITPMIQKEVVSLPPAVLITAQALAGALFGVIGIFLATPLTVVLIAAVQVIYVRDFHGEHVDIIGSRESRRG